MNEPKLVKLPKIQYAILLAALEVIAESRKNTLEKTEKAQRLEAMIEVMGVNVDEELQKLCQRLKNGMVMIVDNCSHAEVECKVKEVGFDQMQKLMGAEPPNPFDSL